MKRIFRQVQSRFPARLAVALALLCTAPGCLEVSSLMQVNKNGSGTITVKTFSRPDQADRFILQALAGLSGRPGVTPETLSGIYSDAQLKHMAGQMGTGVSLERSQKINRDDGAKGVVAHFTFKDVRTVRLGPSIAAAHLQQLGLMPLDWSYRFAHRPTDPATLWILPPANPDPKGALSMREMMAGIDRLPGFNRMIESLVDDVKLKMLMQFEGGIQQTSASHVSAKTPNLITLVDIDLNQLIQRTGLDPLLDIRSLKDIDRLQKKNLPGAKLEKPLEKVSVYYR